jgi:pSer/pThr/pTyr-binding forkhead associated (FHA) protein
MILCTHCGNQNKTGNAFCTSCGNQLSDSRFIIGRLIVLSDSGNREYLIADSTRSIGRDGANDLVIEDDEMSGAHAAITYNQESFWVEDLQSTNGTFLNGERIGEISRLQDEDLLKMGRTLMKFKM